jgi:tetratricopeptide (TPR) repeat protein
MMTTKKRRPDWRSLLVISLTITLLTACGPPGQREAREGRQLVRTGQFSQAIAPLKEATRLLAAAPGPSQSKVWNLLGLAYHGAQQFEAASDAYGRALKLDRDNVAADYNLGCLRLNQGNMQGAIDYLNTFVMLRPHEANGCLRLGAAQCHLALERSGAQRAALMEAARRNFETAGKLAATAQSPNALGVIELYRKTPTADSVKTAAAYFQIAVDRDPHFSPALLNLAIVQQRYLNQPAQAMQNYRKYLALGPTMPHAKEVGKTVEQLDLQTKITITPPTGGRPPYTPPRNTNVFTNLAAPPPKPSPAEAAPQKIAALVPSLPPAEEKSLASPPTAAPPPPISEPAPPPATTTDSSNQTQPALSEMEVVPPRATPPRKTFAQKINPLHWFAGDSNPNSSSPPGVDPPLVAKGAHYTYPLRVTLIPGNRAEAAHWTEEGTQARQRGNLSEAVRDYQQAVKADPTSYEANEALGLAALDSRDYPLALDALNRALTLRSESANARYAFAWTLQKRGYYEDAAKELDKMLIAHPEEARGHLLLGKLDAEKLNQPRLAREHYVRALNLDPQSPQAPAIRVWIEQNH